MCSVQGGFGQAHISQTQSPEVVLQRFPHFQKKLGPLRPCVALTTLNQPPVVAGTGRPVWGHDGLIAFGNASGLLSVFEYAAALWTSIVAA